MYYQLNIYCVTLHFAVLEIKAWPCPQNTYNYINRHNETYELIKAGRLINN